MRNTTTLAFLALALCAAAQTPLTELKGEGMENIRISPTVGETYEVARSLDGRPAVLGCNGADFTSDPSRNGPVCVVPAPGNFCMSLAVDRRKGSTDNEGGLIILRTLPDNRQETLRVGRTAQDSIVVAISTANGTKRKTFPSPRTRLVQLRVEVHGQTAIISSGADENSLKVLLTVSMPSRQGETIEAGIYQRSGFGQHSYVEFGPFSLYPLPS